MDDNNGSQQNDNPAQNIGAASDERTGPERQQANAPHANSGSAYANYKKRVADWFKGKFGGHRLLEWLTFSFEVLTFIALCIYSYFSWGQWQEMKDATFMTGIAVGQTQQMLGQAVEQTRAAQVAAGAAKSAAKTASATLRNQQDAFVIDQRPYLVAESPVFGNTALIPTQGIRANITFKNIGKTPAIKVISHIDLIPYRATTHEAYVAFITSGFNSLREKDRSTRTEISHLSTTSHVGHDAAPQDTFFNTSHPDIALSAVEISDLMSDGKDAGAEAIYFIGVLSYTDAFSKPYMTEFCWYYFGIDIKIWHICDSNNLIR